MLANELHNISMAVVSNEANRIADTLFDIAIEEMSKKAKLGHFDFSLPIEYDVSQDVLDFAIDNLRERLIQNGFSVAQRGRFLDISWRSAKGN